MGTLYDPEFTNVADFDCFSQFVLESVDNLVRMKQDPLFTAAIRDDHKNFADATRTKYVSPFLGTLFSFPNSCYETSAIIVATFVLSICFALTIER